MLKDRQTLVRTLVPACMAAVAYVDPGNFGVNLAAGAFGYQLVFVVLVASAMAGLVQYLAAKLGAATGLSLPELCNAEFSRPWRIALCIKAEVAVLMTDLAEIVGGAVALHLLFGMPVLVGAIAVAAFSSLVMAARIHGHDVYPVVILSLLGVIVAAISWQLLGVPVDRVALLRGLVPSPMRRHAIELAVGIVGATVMPHALHFHSAVARPPGSTPESRRRLAKLALRQHGAMLLRSGTVRSIVIAMSAAGLVNTLIVVVAAGLRLGPGATIERAHEALAASVGPAAAFALAIALLASGLASTIVGVHTGQVVMEGFYPGHLTPHQRRVLTAIPPCLVLALGVDPTRALVLSQVALALVLPGALIPLVILTARRHLMGALTNSRWTTVAAAGASTLVIGMNVYLVVSLLIG